MRAEQSTNTTDAGTKKTTRDLLRLCRNVTERSPLAMIAAEGQTHIVRYANPAFCRLADNTNEELIGRPFAEAVPEGEENGCQALLDRVYGTGETETLADQEHTARFSLPGVYWSYTAWAVVDEEQHPTGVMVQITDTTGTALFRRQVTAMNEELLLSGMRQLELRKAAEGVRQAVSISEALTIYAVRQQERMERVEAGEQRLYQTMRESDHRIKNSLQSVCALLDMQASAHAETIPVGELIQIRSRIKTLAALHDLLTRDVKYDPKAGSLSVRQILRQLLPMLQQVVGIEPIQWSADERRLPVKQATALAVLINELVTNAAKHGGRTAAVQITATEKTMTLVVADDGPGFPEGFDPKQAANMGLELVESVSRLDLGGLAAYENRPEGGARVVIAFPLPNLEDNAPPRLAG